MTNDMERLPYDIRVQIGRALDRLVCDDSTPEQVDKFIATFADFGLRISADDDFGPSPSPRLRVKPLEWRRGYCDDQVTISQATTLGGLYQVRVWKGEVWLDKPGSKSKLPSTEDAVAAAQADYERLILSALADPAPKEQITGWEDDEMLSVEEAWTILCETPDITSPPEYPDHALITMEQLASFMARATPSPAHVTVVDQTTIDRVANAIESAEISHSMTLTRLVDGVATYRVSVHGEVKEFTDNDEADATQQAYAHIRGVKQRRQAEAVITALAVPAPAEHFGKDGDA